MGWERISKRRVLVGDKSTVQPVRFADVTLTNTNVLNLRATPIELVAAPGTGKALEFVKAELFFDYTGAYTETADNLAIKYTNGSGAAVSSTIECTGFVDATADAIATAVPLAATPPLPLANAALVLHNTGDGEYGGGNASNAVKVRTYYRVLNVAWPLV